MWVSGAPIRLVVKSPRRLVREAICGCLDGRSEFAVVGQTGSIDALAELCVLCRPDAALVNAVELTVPKVEALRRTRAAAPGTEVVVAYGEVSPRALDAAAAAGITALVPCSGGLDVVLRKLRESARPPGRRPPDGLALTEHDVRIASLLGSGRSVRDIAKVLQISPNTVQNQKRRLYTKLGVTTASHAVSRASSLGVIGHRSVQPAACGAEDSRSPLVVVYGANGACVDATLRALRAGQIAAVQTRTVPPPPGELSARWRRGLVVVVLVDPSEDDWVVPATLGARAVVVLSAAPDATALVDMLLRGACALVPADAVATDLVAVLSAVVRGYLAVDAAQVAHLAGWMAVRRADGSSAVPTLTPREREILALMVRGHTIRQTAQALSVAAKTVENAQGHLFRKFGVRNRAELLALAHQLGLLDLDQ